MGGYAALGFPALMVKPPESPLQQFGQASNSQSANVTATSSGNTLTTYTQGATIIDVAASTSITWSTAGYATSGATSMVYAVHIKIEAL